MRVVDLQLSFPAILVALILLALTGQGIDRIILALVVVQWAYYARTVRAAALVEMRKEYVDAAVCMGVNEMRILLRHVLPNVLPPVMVVATVQIAQAIALEATLSFLGLGVQPPMASLGTLISAGAQDMEMAWWLLVFPSLAMAATLAAFNFIGDGLRDALDPKDR